MLRQGARCEVLRDILGHANIHVTQNICEKSLRGNHNGTSPRREARTARDGAFVVRVRASWRHGLHFLSKRHSGCNQTVISIFMLRVRHCVECPKCRTRYLPGSSPYANGSYLLPLSANGFSGWILYCACGSPRASSEWRWTELKPYEVCGPAYRRGYGSPDEVWDVT